MLTERDATATAAVRNIETARAFYEGKLGLSLVGEPNDEALTYKAGTRTLLVYRSKEAGSNTATAITWGCADGVDAEVKALQAKGVSFEHYDMPDMKREGDVHVHGDMRAAWFKDPDGNIHALVSG